MKNCSLLAILAIAILISGCKPPLAPITENISQPAHPVVQDDPLTENISQPTQPVVQDETSNPVIFGMKGVAIDLPQKDFDDMKKAGIEILATEWGMEEDVGKARAFLDQVHKAGLKVVMDGGFSARAWGFSDNDWEHLPEGKRPMWQKERVQAWINALKDHPAIYAWDICNEFGENLPSGAGMKNSDWPDSMITIEQIKRAKADVLEADPTRPIHARMYEWEMDDMAPHVKALLDNRIADIISLNLYSNYLDKGKLQWPDVIADTGEYCVNVIKQMSPGTRVWISIGAFEYPGLFRKPTVAALKRDIRNTAGIKGIDGITFFCWGPVNQWDETCDWYLPVTGADLWQTIQSEIARLNQAG
jgi:hypothetical protein